MNGMYQITQTGRRADVYIFGNISRSSWCRGDKSAVGLIDEVKQLDADEIHLHINSMGGSVPEGWAMYNALCEHPAKIVTYADGFVASAALYPYLAGDERIANSTSVFFFHEAITFAEGYADDLRKAADQVDIVTNIGINAFVERTGQAKEYIQKLMKAETWMAPEDALAMNLATAIRSGDSGPAYAQDAVKALFRAVKQEAKAPENRIKKFFA